MKLIKFALDIMSQNTRFKIKLFPLHLITHPPSQNQMSPLVGRKQILPLERFLTIRVGTCQQASLLVPGHICHDVEHGCAPGPRTADWDVPWLMNQFNMPSQVAHIPEFHVTWNTSIFPKLTVDTICLLIPNHDTRLISRNTQGVPIEMKLVPL